MQVNAPLFVAVLLLPCKNREYRVWVLESSDHYLTTISVRVRTRGHFLPFPSKRLCFPYSVCTAYHFNLQRHCCVFSQQEGAGRCRLQELSSNCGSLFESSEHLYLFIAFPPYMVHTPSYAVLTGEDTYKSTCRLAGG